MSDDLTYDLPFDPDTPNLEPETQPIEVAIQKLVEPMLYELHTWQPGQVVKVNDDRTVNIQPLLQTRLRDPSAGPDGDGLVDKPVIQNCLVWTLRGAKWSADIPVDVDDTGIVLFCERSLDSWYQSGGKVDPGDERHHDITDAIFIPGLYSVDDKLPGNGKDWIFSNSDGQGDPSVLTLYQDGHLGLALGTQELTLTFDKNTGDCTMQFPGKMIAKASEVDLGAASDNVALAQKSLTELTNIVNNINQNFQLLVTSLLTGTCSVGPVTFGSPFVPTSCPTPNSVASADTKAG